MGNDSTAPEILAPGAGGSTRLESFCAAGADSFSQLGSAPRPIVPAGNEATPPPPQAGRVLFEVPIAAGSCYGNLREY